MKPDERSLHVVVSSADGFAVSFEDAGAAFERIERLFFEPDGSFVWAENSWQLDGVLYDRDGRVQYLEIKGTGPIQALERLFGALGWPAAPLTFQLVREGRELDEAEFRAWFDKNG